MLYSFDLVKMPNRYIIYFVWAPRIIVFIGTGDQLYSPWHIMIKWVFSIITIYPTGFAHDIFTRFTLNKKYPHHLQEGGC